MRFCECNRNHLDRMHYGPGGILICSLCNGYILYDFCKGADLDSPFMSIARYPIADRCACWHHAWMGIARPVDVKILN